MKKIIFLIILIIGLGVSGFLIWSKNKETQGIAEYFSKQNAQSALLEQVALQPAINDRLTKIANDKKYTIDNAYLELNPYKISPLSAIIIFNTEAEMAVTVYINDTLATTMASGKTHVIPIYGLLEDYENIIKLVANNQEKEYTIKTAKSNLEYPLNVTKKSEKLNREKLYFTVASYATFLTGWDIDGNLRFYFTADMRMDVEWLDNGHMIIGTAQGQFGENFLGFFEIDYLGKIYNYYTLANGFSFESQILKNGNIMTAGGSEAVYITQQIVYEIDPNTGKKVSDINFYELFKNIDPDFPAKFLGQAAIRNGFYYNEDSHEMVVSFRGINTVFCVDYVKKELKWVFTSPDNELFQGEVWQAFLVSSENGRYPLGQHTPQLTSEGYVGFFNNGYNRYGEFKAASNLAKDYQDAYSSAELYKIVDNKATMIWSYDLNKEVFSHQYGLFRVLDNNHKLINFGFNLNDDYRQSETGTLAASELNMDNIYALIVEVSADDEVLFEAKCEEGKYRAFKHALYNESTDSVSLDKLTILNTIADEKTVTKKYNELDFASAQEWFYSLEFTKNTLTTNYDIQASDEIKLYFLNKKGQVYTLNYKEKTTETLRRIFNLELAKADYALFIEVNEVLYNPNITIKY